MFKNVRAAFVVLRERLDDGGKGALRVIILEVVNPGVGSCVLKLMKGEIQGRRVC